MALTTRRKTWDRQAKQRLFRAASQLFARKGYAATSVREIVEAAGVSKPVLYYYFKNKEGLYLDLMQGAMARLEALLTETRNHRGSIQERIIHLAEAAFGLFREQIEVARLAYSIYFGPSQGAPFFDFDALHQRFQDVILALVEEGIRSKELKKKNARDITLALLGIINASMEIVLGQPETGLGKRDLVRMVRLLFEGVAEEQG
jgi:AcrR family transcriptional regulator